jgi:hypothetical protein
LRKTPELLNILESTYGAEGVSVHSRQGRFFSYLRGVNRRAIKGA